MFIFVFLTFPIPSPRPIRPPALPAIEQDISCPEAVKIDDIDPAEVTKNYEAAKAAFSSSESGSVAQAEAQIDVETNREKGNSGKGQFRTINI